MFRPVLLVVVMVLCGFALLFAKPKNMTPREASQIKKAAMAETPGNFAYPGIDKVIGSDATVLIIPYQKNRFETDIAYLKKVGGRWIWVNQGTGIMPEDLVEDGIPLHIAKKLAN